MGSNPTLSAGLSGYTLPIKGAWNIIIDKSESKERQRFTLAHELYHTLNGQLSFSGNVSKQEWDLNESLANHFASCLLMPASLVRDMFVSHGRGWSLDDIVKNMARKFEVSRQAMIIRLKALRLIPEELADELLR